MAATDADLWRDGRGKPISSSAMKPHSRSDLRCASLGEVAHWRYAEGAPFIGGSTADFCREAELAWCYQRREDGECLRTEREMEHLEALRLLPEPTPPAPTDEPMSVEE